MTTRQRPRWATFRGLLAATGLSFVLAGAACEGADSYIYTARRHDPARGCLEPYAAVEVVDGPGVAATCPETCLTVGSDVFVTTMCPPLPAIATELQNDDEACVAARRASAVTCGEDDAADGSTSTGSDGSGPDATTDLDAASSDGGDGG